MQLRKWFESIGVDAVQSVLKHKKQIGKRHSEASRTPQQVMERLEGRVLLSAVLSVNRSNPPAPITAANSVAYAVTLDQITVGIDSTYFKVLTSGPVAANPTVAVAGTGPSYTVTVSGIHGYGNVQLEMLAQGSVTNSFVGQSYTIDQAGPTVLSINRSNPSGTTAPGPTVTFAVTFSTAVTGVDQNDFPAPGTGADFQVMAGGGVTYTDFAVAGSGASYTVTVNGVSGTGTLGLNLVDHHTIHDLSGNPLQNNLATATSLTSPQANSTTFVPHSVAAADLNGDGIPDLVEANENANVGVMLGNGDGTFHTLATFSASASDNTSSVAIGDVNGDGKLDIVTTSRGGSISILLGNGDGSFKPPLVYSPGGTLADPQSLALADVNGDGKIDIVFANSGFADLGVMLGNGNGTFGAQHTFNSGAYPLAVTVADVNGDGKPDLIATGDVSNSVSILLGNGNGTFQTAQTYFAGSFPYAVSVADVNGDGKPDLVVGDLTGPPYSVSVLLANGDGTFQAAKTFATYSQTKGISMADVNGDGIPDLLIAAVSGANQTPGSTEIMLGNGDGTFQAEHALDQGAAPFSVIAADLNGDGKADLISANTASSSVDVMLGNGVGNFTGQIYTIAQVQDIINGTPGNDSITLVQDGDGRDIDWTLGLSSGKVAINDPNGLTINGNGVSAGGTDSIQLIYNAGANPLPNILHLNGIFTINGLSGTNPLANTTMEIGRSTVYINYATGPSPLAMIQQALLTGYNGGAWNGAATASTGVITSIPAANNALQTTAIGYADSSDGLIIGQPANTVELLYTLYGDTGLTGSVGFNDFTRLTQHYNQTTGGTWDTGDFNYDGSVNFSDFTLMTRTYSTSLGSQSAPAASPAAAGASGAAVTTTATSATSGSSSSSTKSTSTGHATGHSKPVNHHPKNRKRRR